MNPFELLVYNLNQMGFFGFLLPWLFMFAVVFGLLVKTKVLGEDIKVSALVALVVAFFTIGYGGPFLANFFVNLFGVAAVVIAGILVIVLFISMAGGDITKLMESKAVIALVAAVGIVVFFIVLAALGGVQIGGDVIGIIFIIIVMAIAVFFVAGGKGG